MTENWHRHYLSLRFRFFQILECGFSVLGLNSCVFSVFTTNFRSFLTENYKTCQKINNLFKANAAISLECYVCFCVFIIRIILPCDVLVPEKYYKEKMISQAIKNIWKTREEYRITDLVSGTFTQHEICTKMSER